MASRPLDLAPLGLEKTVSKLRGPARWPALLAAGGACYNAARSERMFGIGFSELIIIGVILIVAVGPTRMPGMLKAVVRAYQEFRRATRELRASTGIDELLQDEDLKSLRKPLQVPAPKKVTPAKRALSAAEREREAPSAGVDIVEAREAERRPSPEEGERIREAKMASAPGGDDAEAERVRAAKIAAMAPEDDADAERIRAAKIAAMPPDDEEGERIRAAKIAAMPREDDAEAERIRAAKIAAAEADVEE